MDAAGSHAGLSKPWLTLFVPGDCVPWSRAGGGKTGHRFTPPKQAKYAAVLKTLCPKAKVVFTRRHLPVAKQECRQRHGLAAGHIGRIQNRRRMRNRSGAPQRLRRKLHRMPHVRRRPG
jgi:hypothetical protein